MKRGFGNSGFGKIAMAMIAAVFALGAQSCMRDDLEDCFNVYLRVVTDYEKAAETTGTRGALPAPRGWYDQQIGTVTVFVFDEQDRFVASWTGGKYTLGQTYEIPLLLSENKKYHFVAWTNSGDRYGFSHVGESLHGSVTRGEMTMGLDLPADRTLTEDIPHRHHGALNHQAVYSGQDNRFDVVVNAHTYKVNFIIAGLTPRDDQSFNVEVADQNTHHDFAMRHIDGKDTYRHRRTMAPTSSTRAEPRISTSVNLLQIGDPTDTTFKLEKTETTQNGNTTTIVTSPLGQVDPNDPEAGTDLLYAIKRSYFRELCAINGVELPTIMTPEETTRRFEEMNATGELDEALTVMLGQQYEYDIVVKLSSVGLTFEVMDWTYKGNPSVLD